MGQNFLPCDREQELLLPPSLREWLPEDHLAWFVIDAVGEFELSAFYTSYRADGHGRAAHDPAMMVALLLYAYAVGERSSRRIERRCLEDVATRVICVNQAPDHTTIARFRQRHEAALAGLFGDVLALCAAAGLADVAVLAVDGTKVHANASHHATRDCESSSRANARNASAETPLPSRNWLLSVLALRRRTKYLQAIAELSAEQVAAIAAGVALIPAAASVFWAQRQSRSAKQSATAAENQVTEARKQADAAETQAQLAKDAVDTGRDQLSAAQHSVQIAADQLGSSRGVALGQLLLTLDELLLDYVDVHSRLHPRSPDPEWSADNPPTPDEQIRIETYMGLFERVYILITEGIVLPDIARRFYGYRVHNLVHNEWVREKKLRGEASEWTDFIELCEKLKVHIPE